jgi:flagellar biosynthetic protein FliP
VTRGPIRNFVQHLLEMTIAMFVGMFVLGMPAKMLFDALDWTVMTESVVPSTLVMATTMSVGMAVWMRVRGCGWPATLEMSLAMFVPFAVMYPFYWAGMIDGMAVMMVGHILMAPAMIMAMLFRRKEYAHCPHRIVRRRTLSPAAG